MPERIVSIHTHPFRRRYKNQESLYRSLFLGANMKLWLRPGAPGSGTTWNDVTGVNNGSLVNTPTWTEKGLILNGTSQYSNCGTDSSLNLTGAQTITIWCKPNTLTMNNLPVLCGKGYGGTSGIFIGWNQGGLPDQFLWAVNVNGSNNGVKSSKAWGSGDLGLWWHIAATWDGTSYHLYINGVEDSVTFGSAVAPPSTSTPYDVGALYITGSRTRFFDGTIGSVQVRNVALNLQEIALLEKIERQFYGYS